MKAINDREAQLRVISTLNDQLRNEVDKEPLLKLISDNLVKLRQISIRVVELIVLWRD